MNYYSRILLNLSKVTVCNSRNTFPVLNKCATCFNSHRNYSLRRHEPIGLTEKIKARLHKFNVVQKSRLQASGYHLYETVTEQIPYNEYFKKLSLPDTFHSWYVITELHVWMLLVRVMAEGADGRFLRNYLIEAQWEDVSERAKKLGANNPAGLREQIKELSDQFPAAIIGYDEGLLSNDKVLAGAIWRRVYQHNCDNLDDIEVLVQYVRKQLKILDYMTSEDVLYKKNIKWIPLDPIDQ